MTAGKMKAMKTVEEMRVAVLAECERLCPDTYKPYIDDDGCVSIWRKLRWNLEPYFEATAGNETTVLGVDATNWAMFYRLLGLSERDAVEAERAEMMKTVDALSAMVTVDPVAFAQLEAKNAALMAALEKIYAADNDPAIELIAKNALAANEKGGKGE